MFYSIRLMHLFSLCLALDMMLMMTANSLLRNNNPQEGVYDIDRHAHEAEVVQYENKNVLWH